MSKVIDLSHQPSPRANADRLGHVSRFTLQFVTRNSNNPNMSHLNKFLFVLLFILCLFNFIPAVSSHEMLRIAGMGSVSIGISSIDAGGFGNPAALIDVEANNLGFAFSLEDFRYDKLPQNPDEQFASTLSLLSKPSLYYSRAFGDIGFSIGYLSDLRNFVKFTIGNTQSNYIVNERRFDADTAILANYDTLWENGIALGFSKRLQTAIVGMRLKILRQIAKRGRIVSALHLESVHGEDVNPNDPRQLIPAIIDNIEQSIRRNDEVELDSSATGLDFDFGIQTDILTQKLGVEGLTMGLIFTNILHRKLAIARHSEVGIGLGYNPADWITAGLDLRKQFGLPAAPACAWHADRSSAAQAGEKGIAISLGWEIRGKLQRGASVEVAFRNGFDVSSSHKQFAIGFLLGLGNSYWEYALRKDFDGELFSNVSHTVSSTIRF